MERKEVFRGSGTIIIVQNGAQPETAGAEEQYTEILIENNEQPQEQPAEAETTVETAADLQNKPVEANINEAISQQLQRIEDSIKSSVHKDGLIQDLHKEMESLKGDFYASIKRPTIKSIISIDKRMKERLNYIETKLKIGDEPINPLDLLKEFVKNLQFDRTSVIDMLEDDYDLVYFEPETGSAYNPKEHNAIQVVDTTDATLGGTVKEVLYGGYRSSESDKIFLKANIAVYKLKS